MKNKMRFLSVLLLAQMLVASTSFAAPVPELMKALEDQILRLDEAMTTEDPRSKSETTLAVDSDPSNEQWYFQNFFLRIRARWGFDVPGFAKFHVVPELELVWQRPTPEGWGSYKP